MRDYIFDCPRCGCNDPNKIIYQQKHLKDKTDPEYKDKYARICRLTCKKCGFFVQNIDNDIWNKADNVIIKWNNLYDMLRKVKNNEN